jgi:hypothetical protein
MFGYTVEGLVCRFKVSFGLGINREMFEQKAQHCRWLKRWSSIFRF